MKKVILAAAIAALTSTTAIASPAIEDGVKEQSCSGMLVLKRVNPQELSERGKCLIDTVFAEETSGVLEHQAWLRFNGKIYSVPLASLRGLANKEAASALYKETITKQIQADHIAGIVEKLEAEYEQAQLQVLDVFISGTVEDAVALRQKMLDIKKILNASGDPESFQAAIAEVDAASAQRAIDEAYSAVEETVEEVMVETPVETSNEGSDGFGEETCVSC